MKANEMKTSELRFLSLAATSMVVGLSIISWLNQIINLIKSSKFEYFVVGGGDGEARGEVLEKCLSNSVNNSSEECSSLFVA